jgi:hypothetical protein
MNSVRTFSIPFLACILPADAASQPAPPRAPEQPAWVASALRFVPPGMAAGTAVRGGEQTGVLPVFPANANNPKSPASAFTRILACSGLWAPVEKRGVRGWWRGLCANQVTNCS